MRARGERFHRYWEALSQTFRALMSPETFLQFVAPSQPQDTMREEPLGDQVELPKEFLSMISQTPDS